LNGKDWLDKVKTTAHFTTVHYHLVVPKDEEKLRIAEVKHMGETFYVILKDDFERWFGE